MFGSKKSDEEQEVFVEAYRRATGRSEKEARRMWRAIHARSPIKRTIIWWSFQDWFVQHVPWVLCGALFTGWLVAYVLDLPAVSSYALQAAGFALGCSLVGWLLGTIVYLVWHWKSLK